MKKINLMIIAILASAMAFMTSCDDDDEITLPPTVTITDGNQTVMPNTDLYIAYTVTATEGIDEISFLKDGSSYGDPITKDFDTDTTHAATIFIPADEVTETFTISVTVKDKEEAIKQATVTITVDDLIVKSTEPIKLYSAPEDLSGDEPRFASLTNFSTYSWSTAQGNEATIDLMYYNGNYTKGSVPHFVSANVTTEYTHNGEALSGDNTTHFAVLDGDDAALFADWDNIDDDTEIKNISAAITETNVTWTDVAGTIIAFELSSGKKGVIRVQAAVDGNDNGLYYDATADYIEFDVIVQKYGDAIGK